MDPTSGCHNLTPYVLEALKRPEPQPCIGVPKAVEGEKNINGLEQFKGENAKEIVARDARIFEETEESHVVSSHALLESAPRMKSEESQGLLQGAIPGRTQEKETLSPDILAEHLGKIEDQIILLIANHGEIPLDKMMRFKLAALYIQENILIRMLHGMPSQEEAFSKTHSLGDLLPQTPNGVADKSVLELWWISDNEKYFPKACDESLIKLKSACEQLKLSIKLFNKSMSFMMAFEKLLKTDATSESDGDSGSSTSYMSELFGDGAIGRTRALLKRGGDDSFIADQEKAGQCNSALDAQEGLRQNETEVATKESLEDSRSGLWLEREQPSFKLIKLDKVVLVLHHLYQEFSNDTSVGMINVINVDILDTYFRQLMSETELSFIEKEIAHFAFLQSLALLYNKMALECAVLKLGHSAVKSTTIKSATLEQSTHYNRMLHKMTIDSLNNGICRVADYWILNLLASGFLMNYRWKKSDKKMLAMLGAELERSPKQQTEIALSKYTCISISEVLEDVEAFECIAENSSKYNTVALLTKLWNDLGFSLWPYSTTLNPEKALEYLTFIQSEISDPHNQDAMIIKQSMEVAYSLILLMRGSTPTAQLWSERIALYYFISGDPAKATALLEFAKHKNKTFYLGLAMASRREYRVAIQFLEKGNPRDVRIKALLGVLYEKLATTQEKSGEQFSELLSKAELNYRAVITSRPEMNKPFAILLERRSDLLEALTRWKAYECFLHDQVNVSSLRSVRFKTPMERKLVSEKILDLEERLDNKSENSASPLVSNNKSLTKESEENKPEGERSKKRKHKKYRQTFIDRRPDCQEKKTEDIQLEKSSSTQVPNVDSELNVKSASGIDEQTDHQEQSLVENEWQLVTGKSRLTRFYVEHGFSIPSSFSMKEVEPHWVSTRSFRNDLTNQLLLLDVSRNDYDGVLAKIKQYVKKIENPIAKLHFIQNKQWLLRCQSFDKHALYAQCSRSGQSIQELKKELRKSVLDSVRGQVELIFHHAFQRSPSPLWFDNPDLLVKDFKSLIDHVHPEFCVQVGAQFSTAAHVMKDIYWEFTRQRDNGQTCHSLYGHSPNYYSDLAEKFYAFRDFIDPHHVSDIV
ncbi:tetratricopeptide repeat protein [Endozoicomonas sp.]|uniref:tetratricopeptide repeat protein n=1 Tax=Endozoicomonas sp. TaxID=1892382 RepID=UPI003AF5FCF0